MSRRGVVEAIKLNAVVRDDASLKVSLTVDPQTTVAKLKRLIEMEIEQIFNVNILVSSVQDEQGFMLSNNGLVHHHLSPHDTIYVITHRHKQGNDMTLPANLTDLFMTLRYVSASVLKKLAQNQETAEPADVIPDLLHLGFWQTNPEVVTHLLRLFNRILTVQNIPGFLDGCGEMTTGLLLKMLALWLVETTSVFGVHPELGQELLALIYKLSQHQAFASVLRQHRVMKAVVEVSKDSMVTGEVKRMAVHIVRQINGRVGLGAKTSSSDYIPTALQDSGLAFLTLEQILEGLGSSSQQNKLGALKELTTNPNLISEAASRPQYFPHLLNIFTIRPQDKLHSKALSSVVQRLTQVTTRQQACEAMQRGLTTKIHNFLLQTRGENHSIVLEYWRVVALQSANRGVYNVEEGSQLINSPYPQFQATNSKALAEMSERDKKTSAVRFLPYVKDYIRTTLKSNEPATYTQLARVLSNLTLDEQCRYQLLNLKGLEVFVKLLETGHETQNAVLQRCCAKGLTNLSLSSRETKAKALTLLNNALTLLYKGALDSVAAGYLETLLKTKN